MEETNMLFRTMIDLDELEKMCEKRINNTLYWAYPLLCKQIKAKGRITKKMVLENKELLESNYYLVGDLYNEAMARALCELPSDLFPDDVSEPAPTIALIYDDCTIDFNINKDDGEYWLFLFQAESADGHMIKYGDKIQSELEWGHEVSEVIVAIKEHFESLRAKAS